MAEAQTAVVMHFYKLGVAAEQDKLVVLVVQ
jgi:hypothetical protein